MNTVLIAASVVGLAGRPVGVQFFRPQRGPVAPLPLLAIVSQSYPDSLVGLHRQSHDGTPSLVDHSREQSVVECFTFAGSIGPIEGHREEGEAFPLPTSLKRGENRS